MHTNDDTVAPRSPDASTPLSLDGRSVAFLCGSAGVQEVGLLALWSAVARAGGTSRIVSTASGTITCFDHTDRADRIAVDAVVESVDAADFDILVVPGGIAGIDALRTHSGAVDFVRAFVEAGTPVATTGHGAWLLADAGVLAGRTITSTPSLRTDLCNAGAAWVDEPVVQCTNGPNVLVSARGDGDLSTFCEAVVNACAGSAPLVATTPDHTDTRLAFVPSALVPSALWP